MTYKNVFAKEIWIDKIPLIKKENKDARVTKKQFLMWENKKTTWKTRRPKQYETRKTQWLKRNKTQKNADCGFTGRFAKRFSGERPDPLGFELTFLSELKWVVLAGAWPRSFAPRLYSQAPARVPFEKLSYILLFCPNSNFWNRIKSCILIHNTVDFIEILCHYEIMLI